MTELLENRAYSLADDSDAFFDERVDVESSVELDDEVMVRRDGWGLCVFEVLNFLEEDSLGNIEVVPLELADDKILGLTEAEIVEVDDGRVDRPAVLEFSMVIRIVRVFTKQVTVKM